MIKLTGGNGSSKEQSIIILNAKTERGGVDAEYNWFEEKFGEQNIRWELNDQELIDEGDTQYDVLRIKFSSNEIKDFWFDISNFYGRE